MSNPTASFVSTPFGSNVFKDWFEKDQAEIFAKTMMSQMPMIASPGPRDKSRHWDWKASRDSVIVLPEEPTIFRPLKEGEIVFDEYSKIKKSDWKKLYEGSFEADFGAATAGAIETSEPLTVERIKEAMEKAGMGRKIPKKKSTKGDPRRENYSARQFGNIILSNTAAIIGNTTLSDALPGGSGETAQTVHGLIKPLFEEFFLTKGDQWQVTGPMRLSAQSIETGKWKSVSALGGEILHFKDMEIGTRDGVCILWETGNIVGMDEEMIINTTVKSYGDKIVPRESSGNPANRDTLTDMLLGHCGEADIVEEAELAKVRIETAKQAKLLEDIERKSAAYGEGFGSWG